MDVAARCHILPAVGERTAQKLPVGAGDCLVNRTNKSIQHRAFHADPTMPSYPVLLNTTFKWWCCSCSNAPVVGNRLFHHDPVGWPDCTNDGQRTALTARSAGQN